jgi:prenyltransferase beta subunit
MFERTLSTRIVHEDQERPDLYHCMYSSLGTWITDGQIIKTTFGTIVAASYTHHFP